MVTALVAVLAIACGGGDEATLDEFVRNVYEIDVQHEKTADPLRTELNVALADLAPEDKLPGGLKETLAKLFDEEDRFANQIEALDAPEAGKDIQKETVAALRAEAKYGRELVDSLGENTTVGDINSAFESAEGVEVDTRRSSACMSLQKLADDNGIDVDMSC
jgi:hypothetical protein